MSQKTRFTKSALAVAVALFSTQAWTAGFQLNEFSSSGLGRAYSGEGAIADDAGSVSRNPATDYDVRSPDLFHWRGLSSIRTWISAAHRLNRHAA
jgi:long-subunit fatty acid transport protein